MTEVTKPTNTCHDFQKNVEENLVRHFSVLDIVSKFQETNARVNRALFRAVTDCGCIQIDASKQVLPDDCSFEDIRNHVQSTLRGGSSAKTAGTSLKRKSVKICSTLAGMCNALKLDLEEIIHRGKPARGHTGNLSSPLS